MSLIALIGKYPVWGIWVGLGHDRVQLCRFVQGFVRSLSPTCPQGSADSSLTSPLVSSFASDFSCLLFRWYDRIFCVFQCSTMGYRLAVSIRASRLLQRLRREQPNFDCGWPMEVEMVGTASNLID